MCLNPLGCSDHLRLNALPSVCFDTLELSAEALTQAKNLVNKSDAQVGI